MKGHRFDPFSFLFGALFLVVGVTFLFGGSGLDVARPERMWAAATVAVGVTLAVWAVARTIRKEPPSVAPGVDGDVHAEANEVDPIPLTVASTEGSGEPDPS
jgi:hypothetical protein